MGDKIRGPLNALFTGLIFIFGSVVFLYIIVADQGDPGKTWEFITQNGLSGIVQLRLDQALLYGVVIALWQSFILNNPLAWEYRVTMIGKSPKGLKRDIIIGTTIAMLLFRSVREWATGVLSWVGSGGPFIIVWEQYNNTYLPAIAGVENWWVHGFLQYILPLILLVVFLYVVVWRMVIGAVLDLYTKDDDEGGEEELPPIVEPQPAAGGGEGGGEQPVEQPKKGWREKLTGGKKEQAPAAAPAEKPAPAAAAKPAAAEQPAEQPARQGSARDRVNAKRNGGR